MKLMPDLYRHQAAAINPHQKGFTLVELMIVIAILAILGTSIIVFFTNISNKSTAERTVAATQQQTRSVLEMISRDIRMLGLNPRRVSPPPAGAWTGSFNGSTPFGANHIAFSADLNGDGDVNDPYERIAYYINADNELVMETFVLRNIADEDDPDADVDPMTFVMLRNMRATDLEFTYYDDDDNPFIDPADAANNNSMQLYRVEVRLTVQTNSVEGEISRTYSTSVRLRNRR